MKSPDSQAIIIGCLIGIVFWLLSNGFCILIMVEGTCFVIVLMRLLLNLLWVSRKRLRLTEMVIARIIRIAGRRKMPKIDGVQIRREMEEDELYMSPNVEEKNDLEIALLRNEIEGLLFLIKALNERVEVLESGHVVIPEE